MNTKQMAIFFGMALLMVGMVSACPTVVPGNPTCSSLGYNHELKIDNPASGTYNGITFTLAGDSKHFDWSSTSRIDAVIAKGGNKANVYYPTSLSGHGLVSPLNGGGNVPALSHATFCWNNGGGGGCTGAGCGGNGVPEFSAATLGVAMILTTLGIVYLRKKE